MVSQKLRNLRETLRAWALPGGSLHLNADQAAAVSVLLQGVADQAADLEGAAVPPGEVTGDLAPNVIRFSDFRAARLVPKGAA